MRVNCTGYCPQHADPYTRTPCALSKVHKCIHGMATCKPWGSTRFPVRLFIVVALADMHDMLFRPRRHSILLLFIWALILLLPVWALHPPHHAQRWHW
jgi:hypothetical protein